MNRLAVLVFAAASLLSLPMGCDKKQDSPPPATAAASATAPAGGEVPAAESVRLIHQTADKICTCVDRACAVRVREELDAANQQLANRPRAKPTDQEAQAMQVQAGRIQDCMKKLP